MLYAGLDLSRKRLDVCLVDDDGHLVAETAGSTRGCWRSSAVVIWCRRSGCLIRACGPSGSVRASGSILFSIGWR